MHAESHPEPSPTASSHTAGGPFPSASRRRRLLTWAVAVGGIAVGAAAALAMTWPDRHGTQVVQPAVTAPATPVTPGTATTSPPDLTDRGSATADELIAAIDTAVAAAQGRGAECIEVHRGGFLVTVQLADGADVDVVVPSTGAAEVRHQRDDRDRTPSPLLNPDDIHKLVDVAREASAGATLIELSTSDDPGEAFEAVALRADGHQFEISITDAMVATVTDVEDSRD